MWKGESVCVLCVSLVPWDGAPPYRTDGDDGKGKHKKKKHKSESGKKSKRKASDGGEDYGQL